MHKLYLAFLMLIASTVTYAQDSKNVEDYRVTLERLQGGKLSAEQRIGALVTLVDALHETDDPRISLILRREMRKDPRAVEIVVPRLTKVFRVTKDEARLCDLIDMLLAVGEAAPDTIPELDTLVKNSKTYPFAAPRAAALLLSIDPARRDLEQSLSEGLESKNRQARVNAVLALRSAGKRLQAMAPKLVPLLRDSAVEVRVTAAGALWRIGPRGAKIIDVLRESLEEQPVVVQFKPEGVSARGPTHRDLALLYMGQMGHEAREAVSDIVRFVRNEKGPVRLFAVQSLGLIGTATPDVLTALEAAKHDSSEAVAAAAVESLNQLTRRDRR